MRRPQAYVVRLSQGAGRCLTRREDAQYAQFEAPDPAEWCARGYAVVNVDARGATSAIGNRCEVS
jgi:hypothetical protein